MQATAHEMLKVEVGLAARYWLSSQMYAGTWKGIGHGLCQCAVCGAPLATNVMPSLVLALVLICKHSHNLMLLASEERSWLTPFVLVQDSILLFDGSHARNVAVGFLRRLTSVVINPAPDRVAQVRYCLIVTVLRFCL